MQALIFETNDNLVSSFLLSSDLGRLLLGVPPFLIVQDSVGGSSEKFPSNQDSGFHKTIPVRVK